MKRPAALRIQGIFTIRQGFRYTDSGRDLFPKPGGMRTESMKKIVLVVMLAALAGCNTVAGVGDDVSGGARTVQGWMN